MKGWEGIAAEVYLTKSYRTSLYISVHVWFVPRHLVHGYAMVQRNCFDIHKERSIPHVAI